MKKVFLFLTMLVCLVLQGCSSNSSDATSADNNLAGSARIIGSVFNAQNGQPIRDAVVFTQPPTEEVSTTEDGSFEVIAPVGSGGEFRVFAEHLAYDSGTALTVVPDGGTGRVNFALQSSANGLVVSSTALSLVPDKLRETVRLSSTVAGTGFSVLASDPWISVSPLSGMIVNGESLFLDISVQPSLLPGGVSASGEVIINSDNGTGGAFINVLVDLETSGFTGADLTRQKDCRRPDVFRVGLDWPGAALVQFPESVVLPGVGAVRRDIQIPPGNALFVDSIEVTELGTATILHSADGPENTIMELFELNTESRIVSIADFGETDTALGRARIDIALLPGVYCLTLADTFGAFEPGTLLSVAYGFTTAP